VHRVLGFVALVASLMFASGPAFAHHGKAAYNTTKLVTVKGTVTGFRFFNPHAEIFLKVKGTNGKAEKWQGEMTSPNMLARRGWTRSTLKPGENITVIGYRAKNGSRGLWLEKVLASNGKDLYTNTGH
jgi:Family of unknown function (DUF6152)